LGAGEKTYTPSKSGYAFIYKITHVRTGMHYVGFTDMLSRRWAGHRSVAKSEKHKNEPLYRAMNEDGLHMFVMEKLEECGESIKRERELDYMRELDSWNPKKGYNNPDQEANYARKLYFLLNPGQELKYDTLWERRRGVVAGWREPLPRGYEWLEQEQQELDEISQREGRKLMEMVSSLASPVIFASLLC
jgi:group I intron endonuclease